jgi:hypothetical protein
MNSAEQRGSRFFVSYHRRAAEDARLARRLVDELRAAAHQVFIDVDIPVGTDWSAEITQRIRWCDYLVVLLSADSIDSEMVQGEVRLAHQQRRADGSPHVFPIRVGYAGALGYELDSYLGRLQHVAWNDPGDDATVVGRILAAARVREGVGVADAVRPLRAEAPTVDARRPQPSVDPRALLRPSGTVPLNDRYYIWREADDVIARVAAGEGVTLVIKGPRQVGKSSLLARYLDACQQGAKRVVYVDFQLISDAHLTDYPTFMHGLLVVLLRCLERPVDTLPAIISGFDATDVVKAQILDRLDGTFVFAFDEVARVFGRPWQKEFFALLRSWHERRCLQPVWARVDLALVIATEPYLLIDSGYQSAFNVGQEVDLGPFSAAAVGDLNQRYGAPLCAGECQALFELTSGQPYLTRVALYHLVAHPDTPWSTLQTTADRDDGPFADHLKALLMIVHRAGLQAALREVIKRGRVPPGGDSFLTYYRLRGAGLVKKDGERVVPANLLYARFFNTWTGHKFASHGRIIDSINSYLDRIKRVLGGRFW